MNIFQWLESEITRVTEQPFVITQKQVIGGGDVSQAYHLCGEGADYFVKLNNRVYAGMFENEARGLQTLGQFGSIKVPCVVTFGEFEQYRYLVLQYVQMQKRGDIADFATTLARLHLNTHSQFGFDHDNTIGTTAQINQWQSDWGQFFCEQRLVYQFKLLEQLHISPGLIKKGRLLLPKLSRYLNQHKPKPALVHGDLWTGNFAFDQQGEPLIYDPACYYGDHEVDLAMLALIIKSIRLIVVIVNESSLITFIIYLTMLIFLVKVMCTNLS
jgi:protein-ribulosamine 3-kinase